MKMEAGNRKIWTMKISFRLKIRLRRSLKGMKQSMILGGGNI